MLFRVLFYVFLLPAFIVACSKQPISGKLEKGVVHPESDKICAENEFLQETENNKKYGMKRVVKTYSNVSWIDKPALIASINKELGNDSDDLKKLAEEVLDKKRDEELSQLQGLFQFDLGQLIQNFTAASHQNQFVSQLYQLDDSTKKLKPLSANAKIVESSCQHLKISLVGQMQSTPPASVKYFRTFEKVDDQTIKVSTQIQGATLKISFIEIVHWYEITTTRMTEEVVVDTLEKTLAQREIVPSGALLDLFIQAKKSNSDLNKKISDNKIQKDKLLAVVEVDVSLLREINDNKIVSHNLLKRIKNKSNSLIRGNNIQSMALNDITQLPETAPLPPHNSTLTEGTLELEGITDKEQRLIDSFENTYLNLSSLLERELKKIYGYQEYLNEHLPETFNKIVERKKMILNEIVKLNEHAIKLAESAPGHTWTDDYYIQNQTGLSENEISITEYIQSLSVYIDEVVAELDETLISQNNQIKLSNCSRSMAEDVANSDLSTGGTCSSDFDTELPDSSIEKIFLLTHLEYQDLLARIEKMKTQWHEVSTKKDPPLTDNNIEDLLKQGFQLREEIATIDSQLASEIENQTLTSYNESMDEEIKAMKKLLENFESIEKDFEIRLQLLNTASSSDLPLSVEPTE